MSRIGKTVPPRNTETNVRECIVPRGGAGRLALHRHAIPRGAHGFLATKNILPTFIEEPSTIGSF